MKWALLAWLAPCCMDSFNTLLILTMIIITTVIVTTTIIVITIIYRECLWG